MTIFFLFLCFYFNNYLIYSFRIILPNIYNNRGNSINRLCNINDGEQKKYLRQAVFALYGRKKKEIGDKSNNNVTPPSLPKKTKKIPTPASSSSSSGDEALASSNKTKKIVNAEDNINQEAVIDDESMTLDPDLALLEASLRDLDMFMSVSAGDPALILDGSEPSDEDMAAIDNAFRNLGGVDLTSIFENPELTGADLGSTNNGKKKSIKKSGVADMSRAVKPQTAGTFDDDDEFASFGFEEILEGEGVNFSDLASASLPFDDSSDIALPESPREKNGPISKSVKSVVSDSTTNRPSGTFSSKQRAEAQASATAATRAASAKRKKELIAAGLSKEQAVLAVKREQEAAVGQPVTDSSDKIFMDGQEIDSKDSQQGVSPPPLEEFRRLMDSLSTESMFESGGDGWMPSERGVPLSDIISRAERADAKLKEYNEKMEQEMADIPDLSPEDRIWFSGSFYSGGDPMASRVQRTEMEPTSKQIPVYRYVGADGSDDLDSLPDPPDDWEEGMPLPAGFELVGYEDYNEATDADALRLLEAQFNDHCEASEIRLVVAAAVTSPEGGKSLAHEVAEKVFDHLKAGTDNDPRIAYQLLVYSECKKLETESEYTTSDPQPIEQLKDVIQMWCESYNTYHLIDGSAMKAAWGGVMPDIVLSANNLAALLDKVRWALEEDSGDGAILTPRLRALRLRGGAKEMAMGYNTETIDSEFSVVSVR